MRHSSHLAASWILLLCWVATAFVAALHCARLQKEPLRVVESAGVRAWTVGRGERPTEGPMAYARQGDFVLSDGRIVVVVADAARGGHWIDVARTADRGYDYLGLVAPIYDKRLQSAYKIESVAIEGGEGGSPLAVVSRGRDRKRPGLTVETRYEIIPSSGAVVLTTHLQNSSTQPIERLVLGDVIHWGADNVFVPYVGNLSRPSDGATTCTWLCSWQDDFSLGLVPEGDGMRVLFGKNKATIIYGERDLAPGASVAYKRYFPIRGRDIASVSEFAWRLRGEQLGRLEGEVRESPTGRPVGGCPIEIISSLRLPQRFRKKPVTWTYSDDNGRFSVALAPGRYFAMTRRVFGRLGRPIARDYVVEAGQATPLKVPLQVSKKIFLNYEVRDADSGELLPCKLTFISRPGKARVDFGPEWNGPGARETYFSATGRGRINISAGRYRVHVSRGPEYETFVKDIDVAASENNWLRVRLKRVIRMDDHISVDLGVRTDASPGCRVSARDRVIAAAAEGVECLVTGDVGVATDLTSAIAEAGLSKWLSAISGRRIEWRSGKVAGDFLVFPVRPGRVGKARLRREARARKPADLIRAIRRAHRDSLLVVCRPFDRMRGYLSTQGFDPRVRAVGQVDREALDFDLFEMVSTRVDGLTVRLRLLPLYARMLSEVGRYGISAGSDSQYLRGQECGYPRVYVRRSGEAGSSLVEQIRSGLLEGRVLITNGPFIRLLVNGKPPGSLVTDTDGVLDVLLEVRAAPWVDVRAAAVYETGAFAIQRMVPSTRKILRIPPNPRVSPEFQLPRGLKISGPYKHDVVIMAVAMGVEPLAPVVAYDEQRGFGSYPFAITGPIFVDVDGDGKCTPQYKVPVPEEEF